MIAGRRALLVGAGALTASAVAARLAGSSGTDMSVPSFDDIAGASIPSAVETVRTAGFARAGWGAATYVHDPRLDSGFALANPLFAAATTDGRVFRLSPDEPVRPSQFGARATPGGDDTAALRAFFRSGAPLLEGDPGATYVVRPDRAEDVILPVERGFRSDGRGATIRLADRAGEWTALLGSLDPRTDLSGVEIRNWTFDGNMGAASEPEVVNGLLRRARHLVCIRRGSGFRMRNCVVRRLACTNAVLFSGDGNTRDGVVEDCVFEGIGEAPGGVYHDHSTIYLTGDDVHVRRCVFRAARWGASGAVCAVELHPGARYGVEDCRIDAFHTGINIAGVHEADSVAGSVKRNRIETLRRGVAIYSGAYREHRSGWGIDDLAIDANEITIRNELPRGGMSGGGPGVIGIGVISGATLPVRGVVIGSANRLRFGRERGPTDWDGIPVAIGFLEDNRDTLFENCRIEAAEIVDAPAVAVALGFGRGVFRDCSVAPVVVNCGGSPSRRLNDLHRTAVIASATRFEGRIDLSPVVRDTGAARRIVNVFALGARGPSSVDMRLGGSIEIAGPIAGYGFTLFKENNNIVPLLDFRQNFGFYGLAGATVRRGSRVIDTRSGGTYRAAGDGARWSPVEPG